MRIPLVTNGERVSNGTALRLTVMRALSRVSCADFAGQLGFAQIHQHQMIVSAVGGKTKAVRDESIAPELERS